MNSKNSKNLIIAQESEDEDARKTLQTIRERLEGIYNLKRLHLIRNNNNNNKMHSNNNSNDLLLFRNSEEDQLPLSITNSSTHSKSHSTRKFSANVYWMDAVIVTHFYLDIQLNYEYKLNNMFFKIKMKL